MEIFSECSQKALAGLLMATADCEKLMELSRKELCTHPKFSVQASFELIDKESNGKLTPNDFSNFVSRRNTAITRVNLEQLIFQYDTNKDGKLSVEEFSPFVTPPQSETSDIKTKTYPATLYIESLLVRHIELEANWQGQLQTHKRILYMKQDFNAIGAFRCLKPNSDSFINTQCIRDFLIKYKRDVSVIECERIIKRLDKDKDGLINYEDFLQFIIPNDKSVPEKKYNLRTRAQTRTGIRPKIQARVKTQTRPFFRVQSSNAMGTFGLANLGDTSNFFDIIKVFSAQINIDSDIEACKVQLAKNPGLRYQDIFGLFDSQNTGFVDSIQIEKTLRQLQIPFHVNEIFLLIKHYTNNAAQKLDFHEFKNVVLPFWYSEKSGTGKMNEQILEDLKKLLKVTLRGLFHAEIMVQLFFRETNEYFKVFDRIDADQDGVISLSNLERAFQIQGVRYNSEELKRLLKWYTKSYDRGIAYSDFIQELTPKITN